MNGKRNSPVKVKRFATVATIVVVSAILLWRNGYRSGADGPRAAPAVLADYTADTGELTMADVLEMAVAARRSMAENLDDYTARFVQQEVDASGSLGEPTEMRIKVQTRLRGDDQQAPMRVYMKFIAPESVRGRQVLWGEDLYDGKMAVHETGLLLGLKTIWLDPNGIIAMRGQRYPISEMGMVRLVEKLIERGEQDLDNPDVAVTMSDDHTIEGTPVRLIRVRRAKPADIDDDFSLAEIAIDTERQLIVNYRSFGWPEQPEQDPPLLESYSYLDVKTNVGLTRDDFDTTNPEYGYPAF